MLPPTIIYRSICSLEFVSWCIPLIYLIESGTIRCWKRPTATSLDEFGNVSDRTCTPIIRVGAFVRGKPTGIRLFVKKLHTAIEHCLGMRYMYFINISYHFATMLIRSEFFHKLLFLYETSKIETKNNPMLYCSWLIVCNDKKYFLSSANTKINSHSAPKK